MKFNVCHYNRLYYRTLLGLYINNNTSNFIINLFNQLNKLSWSSKPWIKPTSLLFNCTTDKQSLVINSLYQFNSSRNVNKFMLFTTYNFSNSNRTLLKKTSLQTFKKNYSNRILHWLNYSRVFYNFNLNLNFYLQIYFTNYSNNLFIQKIINKTWVSNITNNSKFSTNLSITHNLKHI